MKFEFKPSFERSIKQLLPFERQAVKNITLDLISILSQEKDISKGIGLKRLKGRFWEARHGIRIRIIFRWQKDLVEFVLAGNHDQVKRFLNNF